MFMHLRPALLTLLLPWGGVWAQEPITLHYNERPPYLVSQADGSVAGLTATPASTAFTRADIPFVWMQTPAMRQWQLLKANQGRDCLVGWYRNKARERIAKFTLAIYRNGRTLALASKRNPLLQNNTGIEALLKNRELTLLVKDGYSYGAYVDQLIARLKPVTYSVTQESDYMLQMLENGEHNYLFTTEEEAVSLIERQGKRKADFQFLFFEGMPPGETRHILCSRRVENVLIERLDRALRERHLDNAP